jgi:hypothetical protein
MAGTDTAKGRGPRQGASIGLIGTRLALAGAVLYLLEWVAIIATSPPGPYGPGTATSELVSNYATHAGRAGAAAGWFAIVLLGRVLFVAAVRSSLRSEARLLPVLDLALGAMAVGVVLEVAAYVTDAATARLAADGAGAAVVSALDQTAYWTDLLIAGPTGVAVLATAAAMLRSRRYAGWLCWLGLVSGAAWLATSLIGGVTLGTGNGGGALDPVESLAALTLWVWMIATGVVLWRAPREQAPRATSAPTAGVGTSSDHRAKEKP